jgi:urease accessory protein
MPTATHTDVEVRSTHLRAFTLPACGGTRRVALVPEQAVLLAGDHVSVTVRVGRGQALEVVEPGGTVAYAMRGATARWDVAVEVEEGGSLVWHGEPFVVAEDADVLRTTLIGVAPAARVWLRETLVLGRFGEGPGRLVSRSDVQRDGVPVLVEELDSVLGLGRHRVLDQVLELRGFETGAERPPQPPESATAMVLESGDLLHRWLGAETHRSPLRAQSSSPSAE